MTTPLEPPRWRVKYSRRSATWFHAAEVVFVDATDAQAAKAHVEGAAPSGEAFEVWAVTPSTGAMEAAHVAAVARYEAWLANNAAGIPNERGAC